LTRAVDAVWRVALRVAWRGARIWFRVRRPTMRAACVLVVWEERVLLLDNSYRSDPSLPGGFLKPGEDPLCGALRELDEEVGLRVEPERMRPLGICEHLQDGATLCVHMFELRFASEPRIRIDHREIVSAGFHAPAQVAARLPHFREPVHAVFGT